jgi:hypothetical protein
VEFGEGVLKEAFRRGWGEVQPLVPARVRGEVERYLRCGDVRYGFVEATCAKCEVPRLVALRCRGRGWCPSCTTRRALETGLQLEEELPRLAHRQWTLSLPMAVRFQVVKKPALLKRLEVRLVQAVWRRQRATARRLGASGALRGGGVCFWQYFGSSLQLTPHLHLLVPEAVWTQEGEVVTLPPPDDAEVRAVLERVLRQARRDWEEADEAWAQDEYEQLQAKALQRPLALQLPASAHRRRRVAVVEGFSLHADTAVHGNDRAGLGRLCRYGARGPVSESRLEKLEDGQYRYTPKKGPAFTVTAVALVKRLVALLPPPNRHLTSFHGVYAPNARLRPVVITKPAAAPPPPPPSPPPKQASPPQSAPRRARRHIDWATLHRRTFATDVLQCPCGGRRKLTALHSTRRAAEERLTQLGVPPRSLLLPPQTAPPQLQLPV